jgi:two-component system phosphate regulon sensor histidine kinase PhoR
MDMISTQAVLAGIPSPTLLINAEERIVGLNAAAIQHFGDVSGRSFVTVMRMPALVEALSQVFSGGGARELRVVSVSVSRVETPMQVRVSPLVGSDHAMLVFEDLSGVETAEAMRRDFVANVSHELRTPLTALMGFIETLRGAARDDAAARDRFLAIMEREAMRMNRLVGDLLSLSRVEAEERQRPEHPVDLSLVVQSVMQSLRPQAEAAKVTLERAGETGPMKLPADPDQITQVITNLVENAMKYGGSGGRVEISLRRIAHEPVLRGAAIAVEVRDFGDGIAPQHIARLTERFYRVDTHRSREQGGTGLGLAIVKHIVARHRGRLKITSEQGVGSCFAVLLPET